MNIKLTDGDYQRLLTIAQDLIHFKSDSPHGNEKDIGDYIFHFFKVLGLNVQRQECISGRNNIIARIKGIDSSHCTMYSGHIDTVPLGNLSDWYFSPLDPVVKNGRLYGRGACDMKGSIACTLFAVEYLHHHAIVPPHDLLFIYDVDEENENLGLKKYLKSPPSVDFILVGEPTGLRLNVGHRGVMAFTVTIHGKSAHAGQAALGRNAIYAAADVIKSIQNLQKQLDQNFQEFVGRPSITVTQISGGEKVNVVPDQVKLRIDRRLIFGENCQTCTQQLTRLLKSSTEKLNCTFELEVTTYCPPGKTDPDTAVFQQLALLLKRNGIDNTPAEFPASCEAGILQETCHAPMVIFGPGSIEQAHQVNEYITLEQLYKGAELYILIFAMLSYDKEG